MFSTLFKELVLRNSGNAQFTRSGEMVGTIFGGILGIIRAQKEKKRVANRWVIFLRARRLFASDPVAREAYWGASLDSHLELFGDALLRNMDSGFGQKA